MWSLPVELERLIFETAALQDTDHDNRVRIILVAKRVYEWIRPILYSVAIAREPLGTASWRNAKIADIAPFVRHLLTTLSEKSHVLELMATFRNIENLAIWRGVGITREAVEEMNNLPLRMLSADMSAIDFDWAIKTCRAFKNLTHLEILDLEGSTWDECKVLTELPKLTHLCFDIHLYLEDEVVPNLLERCTSLQVLIFLRDKEPDADNITTFNDPRYLVLQDYTTIEDFIAGWERSANGVIGFWELADIITDARKGNLFKDSSAFVFSRMTWIGHLNDDGVRWYEERLR